MRTAGPVSLNGSSKQWLRACSPLHVIIKLACIANAVYVTVLSTQQTALLYDIGSPHCELETSRHGKTAAQWTYHVQEV